MRLTRKKAIELCIEAWTIHAKTGCTKSKLPKKHLQPLNTCWFCEYHSQQIDRNDERGEVGKCKYCPLYQKYKCLCGATMYGKWRDAKTPKIRKKYAKLFLAQIKELKK